MTVTGKKEYGLWLCMTVLVFAGLLFGFITFGSADQNDACSFSRKSGFYKEPFSLEITANTGERVFYTFDGTLPDEGSIPYAGPIFIDDATPKENTLSMRDDVSAGFYTELIKQHSNEEPPGYVVPDYLIDKCTVIRAVFINEEGERRYEAGTYFVGDTADHTLVKGGYVLSLITEPEALFDEETGIYVTGKTFQDFKESLLTRHDKSPRWGFWEANYTERGIKNERKCELHIFDENGNPAIEKTVGIRIRGNVSRGYLPHGFKLFARNAYDGEEIFPLDIFGDGYRAKRISLDPGGDQRVNPISDYLVQNLVAETNVATMHYIPCSVFLNGEYWGFYWLCENYDEEFVGYHYQCDPEDVVLVKNRTGAAENESYQKMLDYICNNNMSDPACFQKAATMIDLDSYIDYYAIMLYLARCHDWPITNFAVWKADTGKGSFADGKWRWMVFDCNSPCMGYRQATPDHFTLHSLLTINDFSRESEMFASLWVNEEFRIRFRDRMMWIAESCFDAAKVEAFVHEYDSGFQSELRKSWARYYGRNNRKYEEYNASLSEKLDFFRQRYYVVSFWFGNDFFSPWFSEWTYESYQSYRPDREETE